MKKSHKKIGVIVLTGLAVTGSGLSPTFVAHANPRLLSQYLLKDPNHTLDAEATFNFMTVKSNQEKHRYDALYLGDYDKFKEFIWKHRKSNDGKRNLLYPKIGKERHYLLEPAISYYFYITFEDDLDFLKKINELDKYRSLHEGIIIRVGNSYFLIRFNLTHHERNTLPMKILAKEFGFNILYGENNNWYGLYEMDSYLFTRESVRKDLKVTQQVSEKLKREPSKDNTFPNAEDFAYNLRYSNLVIPDIYTRYRIGNYDYIIWK